MLKFIHKIYFYCPIFIQNLLISIYGYRLKKDRYGGIYKEQLKLFKERESYTSKQWKEYQTIELRKLLLHAFSTVPFYNELYSKHGFTYKDFEKFELKDLKKLPFLEKDDLRKFGTTKLLSSKKKPGRFISTGGSTGTPARVYYSKEFHQKWFAVYESRVRNWAGVSIDMERGMIGGKRIIEKPNSKPPFYRYNTSEKQTYFSAYHISKNNVLDYIKGMKKHNVNYMVGYALSNYFLADLIVKNNIEAPKMKAVLTSSEKLTDEMRETFFKAYKCKTFDAYSGVEACGLISENNFGDLLWSPDTGIAEVIDEEGNYTTNGELISTGLLNFDQPLIRYRIGDNIKISENQQTNSGIEMLKIDEISGRTEDEIITKDGRRIISMYKLFLDIPFVKLSQVIQNDYSDFEINVVTEESFSIHHKEIIRKRFFEIIGAEINLKINSVREIEKTKSGKHRLTISNIKYEK